MDMSSFSGSSPPNAQNLFQTKTSPSCLSINKSSPLGFPKSVYQQIQLVEDVHSRSGNSSNINSIPLICDVM